MFLSLRATKAYLYVTRPQFSMAPEREEAVCVFDFEHFLLKCLKLLNVELPSTHLQQNQQSL